MYSFNFIGKGIIYWICKIPIYEFDKIETYCKRNKISLNEFFFNLELLNDFGYRNWNEIHLYHHAIGLLEDKTSFIEIRKKGNRIRKIDTIELLNQQTLFPLYKIRIDTYKKLIKQDDFVFIALVQYAIGLIKKIELNEETLDLNELILNMNYRPLQKCLNLNWVNILFYNNIPIPSKQEDMLILSSEVVLLNIN